jgi:hypothetical protein
MTIPSFTADAALAVPSRPYRTARARGSQGHAIVMQDLYWCGDCWCPPTDDCVVLPGGRCKCLSHADSGERSTLEMLTR